MKNKSFIIYIILSIILFGNYSFGDEFKFEASEIEVKDEGNIVNSSGGVKIISNDNLEIVADQSIYNKKKSILKLEGNVLIKDIKNNIEIFTNKINYLKKNELIIAEEKVRFEIKGKYTVDSENLIFDRNLLEISSSNKTTLKDSFENVFISDEFLFRINEDILNSKNLNLKDNENNSLFLKEAIVDLNKNEIIGKNINIDFDNSLFSNNENEPRLKGNSIVANKNETAVYKGVFTTCKRDKKNCPPWKIYADKVTHKKNKKLIEYKNAWLAIYNKPILYVPYFFHPDPTVKRQSGFLFPTIFNSSNYGSSIQIPYYNVISENKDLTISPRIFFDNSAIIQTEYRQVNKSSSGIVDFSLNKDSSNTRAHLFSNFAGKLKNTSNIEVNFQQVNGDNYLKMHDMKSPLINSKTTLNNFVRIQDFNDDYQYEVSFETFEDLSKSKSDRFEYIYPNYRFSKNIENSYSSNGNLNFESYGYQKQYNTNVYDGVLINDINFDSNSSYSKKGLENNYQLLFRNVNSKASNSENYNEDPSSKVLSLLQFNTKFPLYKKTSKSENYLTPIASIKLSPNNTKNISSLDRAVNYNSIFSIDRFGEHDLVEGGGSLTLGLEYSNKNKNNKDIINLSLANVFRPSKNEDLPINNSIGEKRSDIIGKLNFVPSDSFNFDYEFSLDNNLKGSNLNLIRTNLSVNNFITTFEYLEEDNSMGTKSYVSNKTTLNLNNNNSISFKTNKDLDKNITEYYNLIYEYKNDCLVAGVEYNKSNYTDGDLKPEETLFFKIKIIPFGELNTPSVKQ